MTRDLDQADRILDERDQARVLNRADAQMARDVPVIPLYQVPLRRRRPIDTSGAFVQSPFNPLWNAENWWLER